MKKYNLIKDIEPVRVEGKGINIIRVFICEECGVKYGLNYNQYRHRINRNSVNLCFKCIKEYVIENLKERNLNMTKGQKEKRSRKRQHTMNNKSIEELREINKKK